MPANLAKRLNLEEDDLKDSFYDLYWEKGYSQIMIAQQYGCHVDCIERWFKKLDIPRRKITRQYKDIDLTSNEGEILDGLLLSDLHVEKGWANSRLSFGFKYKEMAQHVMDSLPRFEWRELWKNEQVHRNNCVSWHGKTKSNPVWTAIRDIWYPQGKKIVPHYIELTPTVCYWWYLGDGYIRDYNIQLCTQGFNDNDIRQLVVKLNTINIMCKVSGASRMITIKSKSCDDFLNYIGSCQVPCYNYKWIYPRKRKK